ncbi:MAG: hypothetical protein ABF969_04210 [Sporolactobacillus sp.]
MPIMSYEQYMVPETGKGKLASYHDEHAETYCASEDILWGLAVQENAADPDKVDVYDGTAADGFVGIALANHFAGEYRVDDVSTDPITGTAYAAGQPVSVLRRGIVWIEVAEDVIKGKQAVIDNATGNFRQKGSATSAVSDVVGVFKTSAQSGNLAQVEINLP